MNYQICEFFALIHPITVLRKIKINEFIILIQII